MKSFTEVVLSTSIPWIEILDKIEVYSVDLTSVFLKASDVKWSLVDEYNQCQTIDLTSYSIFRNITPLKIRFYFEKNIHYSVLLTLEPLNLKSKRFIKSTKNHYEGPILTPMYNLNLVEIHILMAKISQTQSLKDGNDCVDYPDNDFTSFGQCDEDFVSKSVEELYNLRPFWVSDSFDTVSKPR